MSEREEDSQSGQTPGKVRTWWHPLLVRLLDFVLAGAYEVTDEINVGKLPLRVDILLIRREEHELPDSARRCLRTITGLLNRFTLIEFKGPTDSLERGDLGQLFGCAHLWLSQQPEEIAAGDVSLIVLAPIITKGLKSELSLLGLNANKQSDGVFKVDGTMFTTWLVETDVLAERDEPVVSLVSRLLLKDVRRIIELMRAGGHGQLVSYVVQQVSQFKSLSGELIMQYKDLERVDDFDATVKAALLEVMSSEELLKGLSTEVRLKGLSSEERLKGLPPEERLKGLPPEERVKGLSAEERLKGLSKEDLANLRKWLDDSEEK